MLNEVQSADTVSNLKVPTYDYHTHRYEYLCKVARQIHIRGMLRVHHKIER